MSVTQDDYVDVIRYVLATNMSAANVQISGNNATLIIKNVHDSGVPTRRPMGPRDVFIICSGVIKNVERANLFYGFENREYVVWIDIECVSRALVVKASKEVTRALHVSRKLYTDTNLLSDVRDLYDIIYLGPLHDNSKELGWFRFTQEVRLLTRVGQIITS